MVFTTASGLTSRTRARLAAAAVGVAVLTAGACVAVTLGGEDTSLTGDALDRASTAALAAVGAGTITDTARHSAAGAVYAVETRLPNGVDVSVELDAGFTVVWVSLPGWTGNGSPETRPHVLDAFEHASIERTSAEQAALAEVGNGTVTGYRRSTALDHAIEVDVSLADGSTRRVELTERSQVVRSPDTAG